MGISRISTRSEIHVGKRELIAPHMGEAVLGSDEWNEGFVQGSDLDIEFIHSMEAARDIWRDFQSEANYTLFQDFYWVEAWLGSVNKHNSIKPLIVLIYQEGVLKMLMPLAINSRLGVKSISWMASGINDYNGPLFLGSFMKCLDENAMHSVWSKILINASSIDYIHFVRQVRDYEKVCNPFILKSAFLSSCASHHTKLKKDWANLYPELRGSKSRKRLNQKLNRFKNLGKVQFRSINNLDEQIDILDLILSWKESQLNSNGDRNPFSKMPFRKTLLDILNYQSKGSTKRKLRIYGLFLNGELKAGKVVILNRGTYSVFINSYDASFKPNCSPGLILQLKTMELAARAGFESFDFMAGDEGYKSQWCDQEVILVDSFKGISILGHGYVFLLSTKLSLKKKLKASRWAMLTLKMINSVSNKFKTSN